MFAKAGTVWKTAIMTNAKENNMFKPRFVAKHLPKLLLQTFVNQNT
jgi:hypothetical protein